MLGAVLLLLWGLWWGDALVHLSLRGAARTWIAVPAFGVDFWTQPDWAVRTWDLGASPYVEDHMFHYPPLVIHLFRWVLLFDPHTALRVWICALGAVTTLGALASWRLRERLGLRRTSATLSIALVLFSYPVLFALERSNFDLITLAAILVAAYLAAVPGGTRQGIAGAVLSVGPWVKIYPGLLGLGLVALRWWRAVAGFGLTAVVIGALEPEELRKSLHLVEKLIAHHSKLEVAGAGVFLPWSHSLSMLVRKALVAVGGAMGQPISQDFPASLAALGLLSPLLAWVALAIGRSKGRDALAYPVLCWFVAAASFVPEVANDYSLVFLPLAALAVWSGRDPPVVHVAYAAGLVALQPVALPIGGFWLLGMKVSALIGVAASMVRRGRELGEGVPGPAAG